MLIDRDELKVEVFPAHLQAFVDGNVEVGHWVLEDGDELLEGDFLRSCVHL